VTNLGGPDTEQTSIATWLDVLADCTVDRLLPGVWRAYCDFNLAPQCRHQAQIA